MELSEKISAIHSDAFKRMLGVRELPKNLLERYFLIKKMTDRVDARLTSSDLARIALESGFDPVTMSFKSKDPNAVDVREEQEEAIEADIEEVKEETPENEEEAIEESDDPKEIDTVGIIAKGTKVQVFYDGEILTGEIKGCTEKNGEVNYSVETDEDTIIVSEDEIEVI